MMCLYISGMNDISLNMEGGYMTCHNIYGVRESSRMLEKIKSKIMTDLAYLLLMGRMSDVSLMK